MRITRSLLIFGLLFLLLLALVNAKISLEDFDEEDDFDEDDVNTLDFEDQAINPPDPIQYPGLELALPQPLDLNKPDNTTEENDVNLQKWQYFYEPEGFDKMLQKKQMVRMSFTGLEMPETPVYILTNSSPILFIPGYSRFYTLGGIEKNFNYFYIEVNPTNVTQLIEKIKGDYPNITSSELYLTWNVVLMKELYDMTNAVSQMDHQVLCLELKYPLFSRGIFDSSRDYTTNKAYYCFDGTDSFYMIQDTLNVVMKFLLHVFRFVIAIAVVGWIATRSKYFRRTDFESTHVSTTYYSPSFWLLLLAPSAKRLSYNIKNWILLSLFAAYTVLLGACIIFTVAPNLYYPRVKEDSYFGLIISQRDFIASRFLFYVFLVPLLFITTVVTGIVKVRVPRVSISSIVKGYSEKKLSYSVNNLTNDPKNIVKLHSSKADLAYFLIEKAVRVLICTFIGVILAAIWTIFLYFISVIRDFNEVMLLLTYSAFAVTITIYMIYQDPQMIYDYIATKSYDLFCGLFKKIKKPEENDKVYTLMDDVQKKKQELIPTNGYIHFYFVYMIPTWIFESIWLSATFLISYTAAVVLARAIWSCVLLFILFPQNLQMYILFATMIGTLMKFVYGLNDPYEDIKAQILGAKTTLNFQRHAATNTRVMNFNQEQLVWAFHCGQKLFYYVPLSLKDFLRVAKGAEVSYLLIQSLLRMLFTNFVLCLFFMASSLFGESIGNSSVLVKLGFATLLPFLPKLVDMFYPGLSKSEKAVFKQRATFVVSCIEIEKTPNLAEIRKVVGRRPSAFVLFPDKTIFTGDAALKDKYMNQVYDVVPEYTPPKKV